MACGGSKDMSMRLFNVAMGQHLPRIELQWFRHPSRRTHSDRFLSASRPQLHAHHYLACVSILRCLAISSASASKSWPLDNSASIVQIPPSCGCPGTGAGLSNVRPGFKIDSRSKGTSIGLGWTLGNGSRLLDRDRAGNATTGRVAAGSATTASASSNSGLAFAIVLYDGNGGFRSITLVSATKGSGCGHRSRIELSPKMDGLMLQRI